MTNFKISTTTILLFFLSFTVINAQTKLSLDFQKKIKEGTPESLPQTPVAYKLKTDVQDENLKGKVKKVIEESASISEEGKPYDRKFFQIMDFDKKGYFLKRIYFTRGEPFQVTVYGYIDRERASKSNCIYCEKRMILVRTEEPKTEELPKPDPRYEYKYKYKYIDNKLSEMQMIYNTGINGMRYVYYYSEKQMEEFAYSDNGKLNQKFLRNFDDQGNEVRLISYAVWQPDGSNDTIYVYKYKSFDKSGNWTQRTLSKVKMENDKEIIIPVAEEYRTITYYP